jgi:transcriptional regulator with XRE-family HTH domain
VPAAVDLRKRLARAVKRFRTARGMTQEKLAEEARLNPRHLQKIEVGAMNVTLETLQRLGHALEVDPGELVAASD